MSHELGLEEVKKEYHGKVSSYLIGFFGSVFLTILSFGAVVRSWFSLPTLAYVISFLALVQAFVQLKCFLKIGHEEKPRWQLLTFFFMVLVLLIIAIGTLWIMFDLNRRMMEM